MTGCVCAFWQRPYTLSERYRVREWLLQMVESAQLIAEYLEGLSSDTFAADNRTVGVVAKRLEWIGELAKRIPESFRAAHPDLPWGDIVRVRDFFAHHYLKIDRQELWITATRDVPDVKNVATALLANLPEE